MSNSSGDREPLLAIALTLLTVYIFRNPLSWSVAFRCTHLLLQKLYSKAGHGGIHAWHNPRHLGS